MGEEKDGAGAPAAAPEPGEGEGDSPSHPASADKGDEGGPEDDSASNDETDEAGLPSIDEAQDSKSGARHVPGTDEEDRLGCAAGNDETRRIAPAGNCEVRGSGKSGARHVPGTAGGTAGGDDETKRIAPGRNRELQVARASGRKLFDAPAQQVFLEWFAATCNAAWAAERAGFNYRTVWKHRMNDPVFAEAYDRAEEQAVARLRSKRLETKRKPIKIGIEGDWDAPEMDDIDPILAATLLREHDRGAGAGRNRKRGRAPRVATTAEVRAALVKRLAAFGVRVFGEPYSPSTAAAGAAGEGEE